MLKSSIILCSFLILSNIGYAKWDGQLVSPQDQRLHSLQDSVRGIQAGQVIIMGETHDYLPDHNNQILFLQQLAKASNAPISVGMEFFEYPTQSIVDSYLQGKLNDPDFLKQVGWGGNDYSQYRSQVLFPASHGGATFALNLPRAISGRIAAVGVENLSAAEAALLPPNFAIGRKSYEERFAQLMADSHQILSATDLEHYFAAQSSWDDTMAWRIAESMQKNPGQILFVIVGKFHVQYGGGLPDRLRARGVQHVLTITQYDAASGNESDLKNEIQLDAKYGAISDLVWIQGEPQP